MKKNLVTLCLLVISSISFAQQNFPREKLETHLAPFYHGVASGDPLSDRVMLWTRITEDTLTTTSTTIQWRIATDTSMLNVVSSGSGQCTAAKDWTFKVDATGLQANTWYYYDFFALGKYSLRGRTKTLPVGDIDSVRLGVVSCSNFEHGYFGSYRLMAQRNDIDCILHLGDYIYEYEVGGYSANISGRDNEPTNEIITLEDYRIRHSHYKLDNDLRAVHQQYPFINVWDDHESANDSYRDGAGNHTPGTEGDWTDRKSYAQQAYFEWLPIREIAPGSVSIYRDFQFGDLINLVMLDTRLEDRDEQVGATSSAVDDPTRTLLGPVQYAWATNKLDNSTARWNILGQQVMMAPLEIFGIPANADQWDGYAYERGELLDFVQTNNVNNFVVLTGDIHTSWVNDIPNGSYNSSNCTGSVGVEFVMTSVTSTSFLTFSVGTSLISTMNPHMSYIDLASRGYGILNITKARTQMDYYYLNDVEDANTQGFFAQGYYVNNNEKCAQQASSFTSRPGTAPILAPALPISLSAQIPEYTNDFLIFGAYPNPVEDNVTLQVYSNGSEEIKMSVYSISGQLIFSEMITSFTKGINYAQLDLSTVAIGTYSIVLETSDYKASKTIVKR
jgi:alkaline phosphatase D